MDGCEAIAALEAYREGNLDVLRSLLGDPADFPNCRGPFPPPLSWRGYPTAGGKRIHADYATPLEEAVILGHEKAARALNAAAARHVDS